MIKKYWIIAVALIVGIVLIPQLTLAQSASFLEPRISRLEADSFQLRSQISRIESQLAQLTGRPLPQTPTPPRQTPRVPPRTPRQPVSSSDPMFERLATLVIELKERVQVLEAQVAELKKR